jgi:hypothetical protein
MLQEHRFKHIQRIRRDKKEGGKILLDNKKAIYGRQDYAEGKKIPPNLKLDPI